MAPLPPSNAAESPQATAAPFTGLLPSAFHHLPFSFPLPPPKLSGLDHAATVHVVGPHSSLLSAAERCVKTLAAALSEHPFFKPLLSIRSELQRFCQMRFRSPRFVSLPSGHSFAAILPGDSVAGLVVTNGIINFLNIYNTLLIIRLVLTWFPNSPPAIVSPLSTLCDPYLNIFRGIIPPLGGTLDLSPILAFLVLNAFTSTAAALPAELPGTITSQQNTCKQHLSFSLTTTQEKWLRRINSKRSKNSDDIECLSSSNSQNKWSSDLMNAPGTHKTRMAMAFPSLVLASLLQLQIETATSTSKQPFCLWVSAKVAGSQRAAAATKGSRGTAAAGGAAATTGGGGPESVKRAHCIPDLPVPPSAVSRNKNRPLAPGGRSISGST
ncbi:YGGT family [Musa troglodytarum]|uniref:YGGT family n=1 Tax=Musa troglodytarum TaxID=320322 RepID=A0A9E7L665_9LILI|nr:YGGT family [Musa troglodytarum]